MKYKEIRTSFWDSYPEFKNDFRTRKKQNDYRVDIRIAFVDYVENLRRNGQITENQAKNITL